MQGRITFIIAHRLSTIRSADEILVFQDKHIVEWGTFDRLVRCEGRFNALVRAQLPSNADPTAAE